MANIKLKSIPQSKMMRYLELEALVEEHKQLKEELISLALLNLPCQPGRYSMKLEFKPGQRRPQWKDIAGTLAEETGRDKEEFYDTVIKNTTPGEKQKSLVVIDRENVVSS